MPANSDSKKIEAIMIFVVVVFSILPVFLFAASSYPALPDAMRSLAVKLFPSLETEPEFHIFVGAAFAVALLIGGFAALLRILLPRPWPTVRINFALWHRRVRLHGRHFRRAYLQFRMLLNLPTAFDFNKPLTRRLNRLQTTLADLSKKHFLRSGKLLAWLDTLVGALKKKGDDEVYPQNELVAVLKAAGFTSRQEPATDQSDPEIFTQEWVGHIIYCLETNAPLPPANASQQYARKAGSRR